MTGTFAAADSNIDQTVFDDGFCQSPPQPGDAWQIEGELSTNSMDCARLMEFVYVSRMKVFDHLANTKAQVHEETPWKLSLRAASRASSLISAHTHVLAAVASQRPECFSEHVRLLLIVNLRRMKSLTDGQFHQLWLVGQDGPQASAELAKKLGNWLTESADLLDADLRTMRTVLRAWRPPLPDEARFFSHEADGRYSTMEALRRDTFKEWQLDTGLMQALLRHVLPVDAAVADFGAGSGQYATWLNDTGLVAAYAFDGSPDIELVTKGAVLNADLGRPLSLWRKFDWTICLEVAESLPADLVPTLLRNLDDHTTEGLVLSWARPGLQGLGHANPQREPEVLRLVRDNTLLYFDKDMTAKLRTSATIAHFSESLYVLVRKPPRDSSEGCGAGEICEARTVPAASVVESDTLAPGCSVEDGWIYAGNDVQMFNNVPTAAACCELCTSNDQCRFWTWSKEESHKELCWIKSTREYRINHDGFVSGARIGAS